MRVGHNPRQALRTTGYDAGRVGALAPGDVDTCSRGGPPDGRSGPIGSGGRAQATMEDERAMSFAKAFPNLRTVAVRSAAVAALGLALVRLRHALVDQPVRHGRDLQARDRARGPGRADLQPGPRAPAEVGLRGRGEEVRGPRQAVPLLRVVAQSPHHDGLRPLRGPGLGRRDRRLQALPPAPPLEPGRGLRPVPARRLALQPDPGREPRPGALGAGAARPAGARGALPQSPSTSPTPATRCRSPAISSPATRWRSAAST